MFYLVYIYIYIYIYVYIYIAIRQNICHYSYETFFVRQLLRMLLILIMFWKQLYEKWKSHICSRCWSNGVKYRKKKLLQTTIPLRKWIQLKVYSHSVKNVWISSLTLILIFCWIELTILRSHIKVSQNFIFNFVFYQTFRWLKAQKEELQNLSTNFLGSWLWVFSLILRKLWRTFSYTALRNLTYW